MYLADEIDVIPLNEQEDLLLNYLSGAADIIDKNIVKQLLDKKFDDVSQEITEQLKDRKYIFDNKESKILFEKSLKDKLEFLERRQVPNFLIIPTYNCNLRCIYCYEQKYKIGKENLYEDKYEWVDKLFESINILIENFKLENKIKVDNNEIYITLMGGEPLLYKNIELITYIINKIKNYNYKYNVITNGFELDKYLDLLSSTNVDCIQVTVDGPKEIHDLRRIDKNGQGSYEKTISNIKKALDRNIKTYLRVNIDESNLDYLPNLAQEIMEYIGISKYFIPYIYLLQDGGCSGDKNIIDEVSCIKKLIGIEKEYPIVKIFNKRFHAQSMIDNILNGKENEFKLRNCSACKEQYILDYKGYIYKCWFGIGNKNFNIGSYINGLKINTKLDLMWKNRNINTLEKCKECKYKFICGGGCVSHIIQSGNELNKERCVDYKSIFKELLVNECCQ